MNPCKSFAVGALLAAILVQAPNALADIALGAPKQPQDDQKGITTPPDAGTSLRQGVVTAVNADRGQIEIQGLWHRVDSGRTRFIRSGQGANIDAVAKGQTLKFTVVATKGEHPTLGVVYVP